ncbi:hypothetical protein SAMN04490179_3370 [Pseudomonas antarctica]|uniref:Uncharacterized protein n=1 Tax=Pseudomonas antarctica TaxID=219572 RepID=A0A1G9ZYL1_9PSED|nr:hypothetical protein PSAN_39270 [Pseudomonas antarctica]SDN25991.1 hypothetical protein SAMN04490179_3370 [Pseudomonas antarctica]
MTRRLYMLRQPQRLCDRAGTPALLLALLRRSRSPNSHRQQLAHRSKTTTPGLDLGAQFANQVGDGTDAVQALR